MCRIIAIANQKGGVGKTTTCVNLGIGLARAGKKVLLVEADAQGSMAVSLGIREPDELDVTLVNIMEKVINDEDVEPGEGIIHHEEGIDFIPANIELAGLETSLVNVMSREQVLRLYLDGIKAGYDYILIDCMPSLGMITINALEGYVDLNCETHNAYNTSGFCNDTVKSEDFPEFLPGRNSVSWTGGISYVEVTPRGWTL